MDKIDYVTKIGGIINSGKQKGVYVEYEDNTGPQTFPRLSVPKV